MWCRARIPWRLPGPRSTGPKTACPGSVREAPVARGDRRAPCVGPDHLIAARPDPHERHGRAAVLGDEVEVLARRARELRDAPARADVLAPALELRVRRCRVVQHRLVVGEAVELRALLTAVAGAH